MLEKGMVVKSAAGHDSGRFYLVVEAGAGYAYIADGKVRRLEKPKRKNERHLRPTKLRLATQEWTNRSLREQLRQFNETLLAD